MEKSFGLLAGRCFCGETSYEVDDDFEYSLICHCRDCQRVTGSAFKPFAGIPAARLRLTKGADAITRLGDDAGHNASCARCGSQLYALVRGGTHVHVTLGTLDEAPSLKPMAHIFVRSKAPWHTICDGLPQHETLP